MRLPWYNPFDVLLYLKHRQFRAYWFETGSPSFLIRTLLEKQAHLPSLERMFAGEELLSRFDVRTIATEALLFQTGYLTICGKSRLGARMVYELGYPNLEVKMSLSEIMLYELVNRPDAQERCLREVYQALEAADMQALREVFHAFFASIPHDWYRNSPLARYEGYYCSIVYCYFVALGLDVTAEDATSHGRIDMTVKLNGRIFIIEFKVVEQEGDGNALAQIKAKGYADKYAGQGEIWLIGASFSSETRNITAFDCQRKPLHHEGVLNLS